MSGLKVTPPSGGPNPSATVAAGVAIAAHDAAADPHTVYQLRSEKNAANGYAPLDSGILVPVANLPTNTTARAGIVAQAPNDTTKFWRGDATWDVPPGGSLEVKETDGTPDVTGVTKIVLPNGSLTDDTGGQVTLTFPGGGGVTVEDEGTPLSTVADTLNFAGSGVTATGSGTTKLITIPGGASDVVQVTSGAGSVTIPGLKGSPDAVPASPNAADEELDSLANFSTLGSLGVSNVTDYPSHWHVYKANTGQQIHGIYKAGPSIPYAVTTKIDEYVYLGNYANYGLMIGDSTPTAWWTFGPAVYLDSLQISSWTNNTTRSGAANVNVTSGGYARVRYVRLVVTSATNVACYWSRDGYVWTAAFTGQDPGFTPAKVGMFVTAEGVAAEAAFDFLRFVTGTAGQTWNGFAWV